MYSIKQLVAIDQDWVPTDPEGSLYLRPIMYASGTFLGVKPSSEYVYVLIASPVGSYFKDGVKPVKVWVSEAFTRAAPGGTGEAKCGGNYAASLAGQLEAASNGCEQVIYLDAAKRRYIEELGGMNVFVVYDDDTLVTPPLSGTILPGITRDTVITLARDLGFEVREQTLPREMLYVADEMFFCGTAVEITPIKTVDKIAVGNGRRGPITEAIQQAFFDIVTGRAEDRHGWLEYVYEGEPRQAVAAGGRVARACDPC